MSQPAQYTADVFLSSPNRSGGSPNKDGSKVLYSSSYYDFKEHKKIAHIGFYDVHQNQEVPIAHGEKFSNPVWLNPDETEDVVMLSKGDEGRTDLIVGHVDSFDSSKYTAGTFEGQVDHLLVTKLTTGSYGICVAGPAKPDGSLHNEGKKDKPDSSGMTWKSLYVRHWDHYVGPNKNSLWYAALKPSTADPKKLEMTSPVNALAGTGLECPIPPFDGTDTFDIGPKGLVLVAKDPDLNPALHTKCNIYLIRLQSFEESSTEIQTIDLGTLKGALTSPKFSPNGTKVAFLGMQEDGYEADRNQLHVISNIDTFNVVRVAYVSADGRGSWDRSPSGLAWSVDGDTIYLMAENEGTRRVFSLATNPLSDSLPTEHPTEGSVSAIYPLSTDKLFLTSSIFADPSIYSVLDLSSQPRGAITVLSSSTDQGSKWGLSPAQFHSITYAGIPASPPTRIATGAPSSPTSSSSSAVPPTKTKTGEIQAWETRPPAFSATQKYPAAILVHGGPQLAWNNGFNARWQPALYAAQGYVVYSPNITGSTGFGQAHVDNITQNWGGTPYAELAALVAHLESVPYVDRGRVVLLGASYGGFMANWVQGQPLGRKLAAIVSHCPITSGAGAQATEELFFVNHDLGGPYSPDPDSAWQRFSPLARAELWRTPMLLIHGQNDFRLPISESLAAFNALQSAGVASKLLVFPDENHFTQRPENVVAWHEEAINFCNLRVGLPAWRSGISGSATVMDAEHSTKEGRRRIRLVK